MSYTEVASQVRAIIHVIIASRSFWLCTLHVTIIKKDMPIVADIFKNANYLLRPLQALNLNEPIRVAQLKLPVVA